MNIEEKINQIIDRVLNEELSKRIEDTIEMVTEAEDRDKFDGRDSEVVGVDSDIKKQRMEEDEVEEGNAFSAARAEAIEKGEDSFEVDGKTYPVEGEEDEVKEEMDEEAKPDFLDLDKDGDKKEPMKKAAKDAKNESKKKVVTLSESEMIELIQRLVMEQKEAIGMKETEKTLKDSKKVNDEAMKEVNKKMADYVKPGSNEKYDAEPTDFPKGNGEMGEEDKMMYHASDAVEEYIDQIARSGGMENLDYDAIKPDEEWLEMNIMGDSKTGNSPEYANAVKTDANEKVNDRRKKNWLAKLKKQSYNKAVQPVEDIAGRKKGDKAAMSPDDIMSALGEGTEDKNKQKVNENIERIKGMFSYNPKTQ